MKKIIDVSDEGLEGLLGEKVTILCCRYIYTGKLVGVNSEDILLEDPSIVYETGSWDTKKYSDVQALPSDLYISKASIESYGKLKG